MEQPRVATYRLQIHAGFGLDEAAALVDYLAALGVSHLYASPYLQAAPGSTHGYDVVDPSRVDDERGGEFSHARLCRALSEAGLAQLLDVVPNHMATSTPENRWWWDVLENGPSSRFAAFFDIDWQAAGGHADGKLLLPVLPDPYGRVLEAGGIRLERRGARFELVCGGRRLPAAPRSLAGLLDRAARRARCDELAFLAESLERLPLPTATDRESTARRHLDKEVIFTRLECLLARDPPIALAVDGVVDELDADVDALHELLEHQNFRLVFWRTAAHESGYRRFFDVSELVGLRVEDPSVFEETHARVLAWLRDGTLDGVRIDHVDGLRDPEGYLRRLRGASPRAWIVVEKILGADERLPESWPVEGTTGYEFLVLVNGLFVDPAGEKPLEELHRSFTGGSEAWDEVARQSKEHVLRESLGGDVHRLAALIAAICEGQRRLRDYSGDEIESALRELLASFSVYRSYVRAEAGEIRDVDRRLAEDAAAGAGARRPDLDPELFAFLRDLLLLRQRGAREADFVMRFQQLTGPVAAKGIEDTAFYRFHRLVCLNEVGGDPGCFGTPPERFHARMREARRRGAFSLLATSTHDTKRGEDLRARLALLSEIPERWAAAVRRWAVRNARLRRGDAPDSGMEYLLYQTLVGAWPVATDRVIAYLEKAAREAKLRTSWRRQDSRYEALLRAFARGALEDPVFRSDLEAFVAPLVGPGRVNSLAQTLLKLTAPGVPDLYQGTELWDHSLVDPDNRRPVDFARRRELLAALSRAGDPAAILARMEEGLPKLWLIRGALALRRRRACAFGPEGSYRALEARGAKATHLLAFVRGEAVAALAPRLVIGLGGDWADTEVVLPEGSWANVLTGERLAGGRVAVEALLARFPVALLERETA